MGLVKRVLPIVIGMSVVLGGASAAAAQTAKDVVGTWILERTSSQMKDGSTIDPWAPNPKGTYILTADGHFAIMHIRSDLPRFASNDRMRGTPEENQAVVQGSFAYYGTYTVDEARKIINLHIDGGTFPAVNDTDAKRPFTIVGDELKTANGATTDASTASTYSLWKRAKPAAAGQ